MRSEVRKYKNMATLLGGICLGLLALFFIMNSKIQDLTYENLELKDASHNSEKWEALERSWTTCQHFTATNSGFGECYVEAHEDEDGFWIEVLASPEA